MKDFKISLLFDYYGECLNEKQRELFDAYYNADLSLSEIAENFGITRQGVRDAVKRAEQQLKEFEEKLHLCEKTQTLKNLADAAADDIEKRAELLQFINNF